MSRDLEKTKDLNYENITWLCFKVLQKISRIWNIKHLIYAKFIHIEVANFSFFPDFFWKLYFYKVTEIVNKYNTIIIHITTNYTTKLS